MTEPNTMEPSAQEGIPSVNQTRRPATSAKVFLVLAAVIVVSVGVAAVVLTRYQAQRKAESDLGNAGMVVSIDATLDDPIHLSTASQKRMGRRIADRVCHDLFPNLKDYADLKPGPRPVSAKYQDGVLKVTFTGVNGKLESDGRISGFSIHDEKGEAVPLIYRAVLDPADTDAVLLYLAPKPPQNAAVRYGAGKDPYCNVHDAADRPVPAFGPLPIQQ